MKLMEIPKPSMTRGEVLLRVMIVGYCGTDLNTYRGLNPLVSYPRIPGHEIGAIIEACGEDVPSAWKTGMAVTCSPYTNCGTCSACEAERPNACQWNTTFGVQREGALTEFICVPWQKLFHMPGLSAAQHAIVEPLAVGFHGVDRGEVKAGETIVVLGSGMVGLGAIASATHMRGAKVIAVDVDDSKLEMARKVGAAEVINSSTESLHDRLVAATNGSGPDVVIEAVGRAETFVAAISEVCYAGRVVYIGYSMTPVEYQTKYFLLKELNIFGSRGSTGKDFAAVIDLLELRKFPVDQIITCTVPFLRAAEAMAYWDSHAAEVTKIHVAVQ